MSAVKQMPLDGEPWYTAAGPDDDVAVSTRVRLSRNLANFPFPARFRGDDSERVQSLVFDSFSQFENPDQYHTIPVNALDDAGMKVLTERGVIGMPPGTGIVMRNDGRVSCSINSVDHVRILSFAPGLDCKNAFDFCRTVDDRLQQTLQFAASYEYGYLTASLNDAGSGMNISVCVHIPSAAEAGLADSLMKEMQSRGFTVSAPYGTGGRTGGALGSFYNISTNSARLGNELDQMASIQAAGIFIAETERKIRLDYAENKQTVVHNHLLRSFALAKFSTLLSWRESVELISDLKWGVELGIISGVSSSSLSALLYRMQDGHLMYLLSSGDFSFEKDIAQSVPQKIERLRAISMQESIEEVVFKK